MRARRGMAAANRLMASILRGATTVKQAAEMLVSALPSAKRWEQTVAVTEQDSVLLNETRDDRTLRDLFLLEATEFECDEELDIRSKLACFFKHKVEQIKEDNTARQKRNKNSLKLMSMHGVKGLEFDVVFVVQAVDGEMPLTCNDDDDDVDVDENDPDAPEQWPLPPTQRCDVQEERRLFYVAMTRARKRLVLCWMEAVGKTLHTMSPFIEEIPRKYLVSLHKHKRNLPQAPQQEEAADSPAKGSSPAKDTDTPQTPAVLNAPPTESSNTPAVKPAVQPIQQSRDTPAEGPGTEQHSTLDATAPGDDVMETKENQDKQQFLRPLSHQCRSIISKLALKWGQQKAFMEPARLVAKLRALLDRRLCTGSSSAVEQTRRPALREAKEALLKPEAILFAGAVLKDIESGTHLDIVIKPNGSAKWTSGGSASRPPSEKQLSFLRALGCSEKPATSRGACEMIEKFKKR